MYETESEVAALQEPSEIAATKLATMGLTIDALTQEQITYANDYSAGT